MPRTGWGPISDSGRPASGDSRDDWVGMTEGASEYGIRISRVFDAPRERVWREWTEPERFADWYGGPQCEVPLDSVSMDVRAGGRWRLTMFVPPDQRRIDWKGEYLEVIAPERLVFT